MPCPVTAVSVGSSPINPVPKMNQQEVQALIDKAIDKHNKTASLISACLGGILLFFYAHGVICLVDGYK